MKKKLVSVTEEQLEWLKNTAEVRGISVSELIRQLVDSARLHYLLRHLAKMVKETEDGLAQLAESTDTQSRTDSPGSQLALEVTGMGAGKDYPPSQSVDSDCTIFTSITQL